MRRTATMLNMTARWLAVLLSAELAFAKVGVNESSTRIDVYNSRLHVSIDKTNGYPDRMSLDGVDLLGKILRETPVPGGPTGSGVSGVGPYLDCFCVLEGNGNHSPGTDDAEYHIFKGKDATATDWVGIVMSDRHPGSDQLMEQYWFLRGEETGLHTFSRIAYPRSATHPTRSLLQEFRTLFRPNTQLWTHLSVNDDLEAPLPYPIHLHNAKQVQDATWDLDQFRSQDPFVDQFNRYFTKYSFADTWRDHTVHGLFGNGSGNPPGISGTWGAWLVMNTRDTYYGGPTHSDLTVDGIVYNYMVSNHHGANVPNLTAGFDRTFGPSYYHFNRGLDGGKMVDLRGDAAQYADPTWNSLFYESIAQYVPGFTRSSERGTLRGKVKLPSGATKATAVLSASGLDYQDNAAAPTAAQYWGQLDKSGTLDVPSIIPGMYRLTVYADGIFGEYIMDNIEVKRGAPTILPPITWKEDSHGTEIWRIGTPDRSAGEFKHGYSRDANHILKPQEYRIFWGAYDFNKDFPNGVRFHINQSREEEDWNYVHWSSFAGQSNPNISDWRVLWHQEGNWTKIGKGKVTLTLRLAGVKTASGNSHLFERGKRYQDLSFVVIVNKHELPGWTISHTHSSSCAIRSGISCYNTANEFVFDASILRPGENELILRLPSRARAFETADMVGQVYVQYDTLRLEIE